MSHISMHPMITEPKDDLVTKERIELYFINIGIPNMNHFGYCRYLQSKKPIEHHYHENSFEICCHLKGCQVYSVNGEKYETRGGDVFLTYPEEPHDTGEFMEAKAEFYFFSFYAAPHTSNFLGLDESASHYLVAGLLNMKSRQFKGSDSLRNILNNIVTVYLSDSPIKKVRVQSLLLELFCQIIELEKRGVTRNIPCDIQKIIDYIDERAYEPMNIRRLAKSIGISESRFKNKFKQYAGWTPNDYILNSKIALAKEILYYTHMTITEIAFLLNFSSSQYFSTVFKRFENLSPSEYRKRRQER